MHRVTMIRRPSRPRGLPVRGLCTVLLAAAGSVGRAADVPPELVAEFTRRVQPLVLNRCAAGACHGGPASPAPRFARRDPHGGIDRRSTLANLEQFLMAVGPERNAGTLAALLAVQHPTAPASPQLVAAPLSPRERATLDQWLWAVRIAEHRTRDPAVVQASAITPAPAPVAPKEPAATAVPGLQPVPSQPPASLPASAAVQTLPATPSVPVPAAPVNRFKNLLDSAANPPHLPPPQQPQGVIFPNDVPPADD